MQIKLRDYVPSFAEDKNAAKTLRLTQIVPALEMEESVLLDFEGIEGTTQSFIHALISDLFRKYSPQILDRLLFKNCNETVQKIITIVSDYMQEA